MNHRARMEPVEVKEFIPKEDFPEHELLKEIEQELNKLVGLEEVEKIIKEIYAWIIINKKREQAGLKAGKQVLHMMFKGNPGNRENYSSTAYRKVVP